MIILFIMGLPFLLNDVIVVGIGLILINE